MAKHRARRTGARRRSGSAFPPSPRTSVALGRHVAVPTHRGPSGIVRSLPSATVVAGVLTLVVTTGGPASTTQTGTTADPGADGPPSRGAALALASPVAADSAARLTTERRLAVSRDSRRRAGQRQAQRRTTQQVEARAQQRAQALAELDAAADAQAVEIRQDQWVLPLAGYRITATFGQYGLWASSHQGLDFAAPSGTPIRAVASGTITEAGYDGALGNKTVLRTADGDDVWFCHQTSIAVSVGQTVRAGEVIGYVGSTGNSTGPHLHLEVHPGGAEQAVDPYAVLVARGLTP